MIIRTIPIAAVALMAITLVGCRHDAILTIDDAIVAPGERGVTLTAYVKSENRLGLRRGIAGRTIEFYLAGDKLGHARTDRDGRAEIHFRPPNQPPRSFEVRSSSGATPLRAAGRIFTWDPRRVIIVVDIDETLSETDLEELLLQDSDDESDPLDDAPETLRMLARDFHLLYLTARPRFLIEKTRAWMDRHRFPRAPLICSPHWKKSLSGGGEFKYETVADLRRRFPNILIGIGDKRSDAEAYARNGLLPIIVLDKAKKDVEDHPPPGALVFDEWEDVADYFARNIANLRDPQSVKRTINPARAND